MVKLKINSPEPPDPGGKPGLGRSVAWGLALATLPYTYLILIAPLDDDEHAWAIALAPLFCVVLPSPAGLMLAALGKLNGGNFATIPPGYLVAAVLMLNPPFYATLVHSHRLKRWRDPEGLAPDVSVTFSWTSQASERSEDPPDD